MQWPSLPWRSVLHQAQMTSWEVPTVTIIPDICAEPPLLWMWVHMHRLSISASRLRKAGRSCVIFLFVQIRKFPLRDPIPSGWFSLILRACSSVNSDNSTHMLSGLNEITYAVCWAVSRTGAAFDKCQPLWLSGPWEAQGYIAGKWECREGNPSLFMPSHTFYTLCPTL